MTDAKRFHKAASVAAEGDRFAVLLDGRRAKTPRGNALSAPTAALAQAIADEWNAQGEEIDRNSIPLTTLVSTAVDADDETLALWRNETLDYIETDLVCHRADRPAALIERQAKTWTPYADWIASAFGVRLQIVEGVIAGTQHSGNRDIIAKALAGVSRETLFGLRQATGLAGSLVLALALWKGFADAEKIFAASRVDEHFQAEAWGVDAEAQAREDAMRAAFSDVARLLSLLGS